MIRFIWKAHIRIYKLTAGRLGARLLDMPVLLLNSRGRKTGKTHITALSYVKDGENYILAASNGGSHRHPDWWFNLEANPLASIQVSKKSLNVRAREIKGIQRGRLWDRFVEMEKSYRRYEKSTSRRIPLIELMPEKPKNNPHEQ